MDEFHYQNNLLAAMNEKLVSENKMYRLVCETSSNAFIYFNFAETIRLIKEVSKKNTVLHFMLRCLRKVKRIYRKLFNNGK